MCIPKPNRTEIPLPDCCHPAAPPAKRTVGIIAPRNDYSYTPGGRPNFPGNPNVSRGPLVSTVNFSNLRPKNFGLRTLVDEPTVENIVRATQTYDATDAARVRDQVRSEAKMSDAVNEIVRMYGEVISENAERVTNPVAELRAVGVYLQTLDAMIKNVPL